MLLAGQVPSSGSNRRRGHKRSSLREGISPTQLELLLRLTVTSSSLIQMPSGVRAGSFASIRQLGHRLWSLRADSSARPPPLHWGLPVTYLSLMLTVESS